MKTKINDFICDKERSVSNCYGCEHVKANHIKRTFYCDAKTSPAYQSIKITDELKRVFVMALKTGYLPNWGVDCLYSFFVKSGCQLGADCETCKAAEAFLTFQETGVWESPTDEIEERLPPFSINI